MKLPVIHFNCKYFEGSRPCFPNKQYGIFCDNCEYYERDENIKEEFPVIEDAGSIINGIQNGRSNICLIKLDASGDVLRTTSLLPSLKSKYPDSSVTWITKTKSYPLLKNNELIDEIYFADDDLTECYNKNFDIALNLDTAKESSEIMNRVNSGTKYGYCLANDKPYPVNELACEWYLMAVNDNVKRANKKTYHQIIHEICGLDYNDSKPMLKVTDETKKIAGKITEKYSLRNFREFILINLGGGSRWQNKKWTKEGYASVVNELSQDRALCLGVIAGDDDIPFYNEVVTLLDQKNNVFHLGCENSLEEFIAIIYAADKILTSDSLALHIATALSKDTFVLVGPTSYTELDVFGKGKILHSTEMECKCFYENKCRYDVNCMTTLRPSMVIESLR